MKLNNRIQELEQLLQQETAEKDRLLSAIALRPLITEDLITLAGDKIMVNGKILPADEVNQLRSEAHVLKQMRIWKLLNEGVSEKAREVMFTNAQTFEDMRFGKTVFYIQDLMKNIIKVIENPTLDERMKKVVHSKQ